MYMSKMLHNTTRRRVTLGTVQSPTKFGGQIDLQLPWMFQGTFRQPQPSRGHGSMQQLCTGYKAINLSKHICSRFCTEYKAIRTQFPQNMHSLQELQPQRTWSSRSIEAKSNPLQSSSASRSNSGSFIGRGRWLMSAKPI